MCASNEKKKFLPTFFSEPYNIYQLNFSGLNSAPINFETNFFLKLKLYFWEGVWSFLHNRENMG